MNVTKMAAPDQHGVRIMRPRLQTEGHGRRRHLNATGSVDLSSQFEVQDDYIYQP